MPITIGEVVKRLRNERGLSQYDIEKLSGGLIKRGWLASFETIKQVRAPADEKFVKLAELLGTTVAEIYREAGIIDIPPEGTTPEEKRLIEDYRALSTADRKRALRLMRDLLSADSVEEVSQRGKDQDQDKAA